MVVEIAAGRLLAPYVGMSLYTWTAIIAVVLGGLSAGHWIGGRLAAPDATPVQLARRTGAAFLVAGLACLAALPVLRWAAATVLPRDWSPVTAIVSITTLAFLVPSLAAGVVSPLLTKMAIDERPGQSGRILGRMYALGAAGAIAGTLLAGFVFIGWVGSHGTFLATAAVYGVLGLAFVLVRARRRAVAGVLLSTATAGGLTAWGTSIDAFESACTVESAYYCIRIDDFASLSGRPSGLMALDHMAHGMNDKADPTLLYSPYLHFLDEVVARRFPGPALSAFFIGGGAFTLPRAWQASYTALDAVVAEIDPAVTETAKSHLWFTPDARVRIENGDARRLLQALPVEPRFDVVFGDAFHDFTIPAHLVTREFHDAVAARLRPRGLYAINVVESRQNPRFLRALVRTLQQTFASVEIWLEESDVYGSGRVTFMVLAGAEPLPVHVLASTRGLQRRWWRMPPEALGPVAEPLVLTDDHAPVDRLMTHVVLDRALAQ